MLKILCVEILDEYVRSYITLLVMTVQNVLNVLSIEVLSEYITSYLTVPYPTYPVLYFLYWDIRVNTANYVTRPLNY